MRYTYIAFPTCFTKWSTTCAAYPTSRPSFRAWSIPAMRASIQASSRLQCSIQCSFWCSFQCSLWCSVQCSVQRSVQRRFQCSAQCRVQCSVQCSIQFSLQCSVRWHLQCRLQRRLRCRLHYRFPSSCVSRAIFRLSLYMSSPSLKKAIETIVLTSRRKLNAVEISRLEILQNVWRTKLPHWRSLLKRKQFSSRSGLFADALQLHAQGLKDRVSISVLCHHMATLLVTVKYRQIRPDLQ